jgi:hypothetical protein
MNKSNYQIVCLNPGLNQLLILFKGKSVAILAGTRSQINEGYINPAIIHHVSIASIFFDYYKSNDYEGFVILGNILKQLPKIAGAGKTIKDILGHLYQKSIGAKDCISVSVLNNSLFQVILILFKAIISQIIKLLSNTMPLVNLIPGERNHSFNCLHLKKHQEAMKFYYCVNLYRAIKLSALITEKRGVSYA